MSKLAGFPLDFPFTVSITKKGIRTGKAKDCKLCPTAEAIQELVGSAYKVRTHTTATHIFTSHVSDAEITCGAVRPLWIMRHGYVLTDWIRGYDANPAGAKPIEVEINEAMIN